MSKGRLEAFSDGVIAVIINIMVLEMKAPHGIGFDALRPLIPIFLSYALSFVFTSWMGENHFAALPVALYGAVMLFAGVAYFILTRTLIAHHGESSDLAAALGRDLKGQVSLVLYAAAIPLSFAHSWIGCALYVVVAVMWLVPDRRIEKMLAPRTSS